MASENHGKSYGAKNVGRMKRQHKWQRKEGREPASTTTLIPKT